MDLKQIVKKAKDKYPTHKSDGTELCYNMARLEAVGWVLNEVKKLNIDDVSKAKAELLGKFYMHLSEQAIIDDVCRNDAEMEEAIRKFNL